MLRVFIGGLALLAVLAFEVRAQEEPLANWPHWRGPLATGFAPKADPPVHWDAKTNIKWKAALAGPGQRHADRLGRSGLHRDRDQDRPRRRPQGPAEDRS